MLVDHCMHYCQGESPLKAKEWWCPPWLIDAMIRIVEKSSSPAPFPLLCNSRRHNHAYMMSPPSRRG